MGLTISWPLSTVVAKALFLRLIGGERLGSKVSDIKRVLDHLLPGVILTFGRYQLDDQPILIRPSSHETTFPQNSNLAIEIESIRRQKKVNRIQLKKILSLSAKGITVGLDPLQFK